MEDKNNKSIFNFYQAGLYIVIASVLCFSVYFYIFYNENIDFDKTILLYVGLGTFILGMVLLLIGHRNNLKEKEKAKERFVASYKAQQKEIEKSVSKEKKTEVDSNAKKETKESKK